MTSSHPAHSPAHHWRRSLPLAAGLLAVLLLLITRGPAIVNQLKRSQAGQTLAAALLLRAQSGDLPGGAGAPGIYGLARAADTSAVAPRRAEVLRTLQTASTQLTSVVGAEWLLGIAQGSLGDYVQAETTLRNVPPDNLFATLALGNVLDAQGQVDAARAVWQPIQAERALTLQLYRIGAAAAKEGNRAQGETLLLQAVAIDPQNANAYHALGGFYWGTDRAKSLEMYRKALAIGGLSPFFQALAEARIAVDEDRLEDAATALETAVRLQPENSDAVTLLGTTLSRLGRLPEAIKLLEQAAAQSPRAFWPLLELGRIYLDLGDYGQAITTLSTAAGRRADVAQTFEWLAEAYHGDGQVQPAINAWQQAITLSPNNATYHARLGELYAGQGEEEAAIAAYRKALALNPELDVARLGLLALGVEP